MCRQSALCDLQIDSVNDYDFFREGSLFIDNDYLLRVFKCAWSYRARIECVRQHLAACARRPPSGAASTQSLRYLRDRRYQRATECVSHRCTTR